MRIRFIRRLVCILALLSLAGIAFASELPRPAPPLTVKTVGGATISLEQLRGKVVVVMFFSTDCPHCQRATQQIAPVYSSWKSRGLEILGMAVNPSAATNIQNFAQTYNAQFPLALAGRAEWASMGGFSLMKRPPYVPHMLFVDRKGVIREERHGGNRGFQRDLQSRFAALVDGLLKEPASD